MNLRAYSEAKGLPVDFLKGLGLKDSAGNLEIPYLAADGQPFRSRFRNDTKRWWSEGDGLIPGGLSLLEPGLYICLTEGESDAQTLWFLGFRALAIPGASTFKAAWAEYVLTYPTLYVAGDNDDAGRRFNQDVAGKLREGGYRGEIKIISLPAGVKDVNDLFRQDPDAFKKTFERVMIEALAIEQMPPPFAESLKDFMSSGPDIVEWLVPEILPRGGLAILAARPKAGKSLLTFNLALGLRRGRFLGRECEPARALICQLEDPPPLIRERLKMMVPEDGVYIRAGLGLAQEDMAALPGFIKDNDIALVVIDPLVFAAGGADENDAAKMGKFFLALRKLAFETGAAILVVHHHRKSPGDHGDAIRGSSAILGAVDVALELRREDEDTAATLYITSRMAAVEPETLTLNVETLTWESQGSAKHFKKTRRQNEIMAAILDEGEAGISTISEILGLDPAAFRHDLKNLVAEGLVNERKQPTKGRPKFFYSLPPEGSGKPPKSNDNSEKNKPADQAIAANNGLLGTNRTLGVKESSEKPPLEVKR